MDGDKDTVAMVQRLLLSRGYVSGDPPTGELGRKTMDAILIFRSRNNLPLATTIDPEFIKCLESAPDKALSVEQATATKDEIAPKVKMVGVTDEVQNSSWWTKLWAWVAGLPSMLIMLLGFVIDHIDEASAVVTPLKNMLYEIKDISPLVWVGLISLIALVMGYQAMTISKLSKKMSDAVVGGYQRGTIQNDLPPKEAA